MEKNRKSTEDFVHNERLSGRLLAKWLPFFFSVLILLAVFAFIACLDPVRELLSGFFLMLSPVIYGIALAYLCNPIHSFLKRNFDRSFGKKKGLTKLRAKFSQAFSIILTLLFLLAIVFLLGYVILPNLYQSISDLIATLPKKLGDAVKVMQKWNLDTTWAGGFESTLTDLLKQAQSGIGNLIPNAMGDLVSAITSGIFSLVFQVISFIIGLVIMIYVLVEKDRFARQAKMILYACFKPEKANDILDAARHGNKIFSGFISGKLLDSLIVGIICCIFMLITRMPYVVLVSFIIGITNIVPYFGPIVGAVPTVLLLFLDDPRKGIAFLIFVVVLQQVDGNLLGPKILGNITGISTFWVTVSLLVFGWAFGVIGMILGVPIFAVLYYLINRGICKKLSRKGLSPYSADWEQVTYIDPKTGKPIYENVDAEACGLTSDQSDCPNEEEL